MKKVKKGMFGCIILLVIMLITVTCDGVFSDPVVSNNSGITIDSLVDLGTHIGIAWGNGRVTSVSQSKVGNWDAEDISDPKIIKRGNTYMMWYSGKGSDGVWRIGYATSNDGISWDKDFINNPIISTNSNEDSLDKDGIKISNIIYDKEDKLYKMWYVGWNNRLERFSLFLAQSRRPNRDWYKYPNNSTETTSPPALIIKLEDNLTDATNDAFSAPYIDKGIGSMSSLKETYYVDNSPTYTYRFWVTVVDENNNPCIKSGAYGSEINWGSNVNILKSLLDTDMAGQFYAGGYMMPMVMKDLYEKKMIYKMWFLSYSDTDSSEVGLAYSKTGGEQYIYYNTGNKESLFSTNTISPADEKAIKTPFVIRDNNLYKMWYVGVDNSGKASICYKESK